MAKNMEQFGETLTLMLNNVVSVLQCLKKEKAECLRFV